MEFHENSMEYSTGIPLATGDEEVTFRKVKVKGQDRWERYALY